MCFFRNKIRSCFESDHRGVKSLMAKSYAVKKLILMKSTNNFVIVNLIYVH